MSGDSRGVLFSKGAGEEGQRFCIRLKPLGRELRASGTLTDILRKAPLPLWIGGNIWQGYW